MYKKLILKTVLLLILISIPLLVMAQGVILDPSIKPLYATDIQVTGEGNRASLANAVLQMISGGLIYLAGPVAVLMLAIGGLRYITSRGDQTQMEEAKKTITWSIAGLIVIILSWAIITNVMWIALHGGEIGTEQAADYTKAPTQTGTDAGGAGTDAGAGAAAGAGTGEGAGSSVATPE